MTAKHQRFVTEYLVDYNATQAATRAGYSAKTARQQGARLLSNAAIAAAVKARQQQQLEAAGLRADRVLLELCRLAFLNPADFFHADGSAKLPQQLTVEQASALAGFEVLIKNAKAGDGEQDTIHKFKFWDKTRALELLAKHFGLLTQKIEVSGKVTLEDLVAGSRAADGA